MVGLFFKNLTQLSFSLYFSTYLTSLGEYYSKLSGETPEAVINRFFGIFFAMFQSCNYLFVLYKNLNNFFLLKRLFGEILLAQ